MTSLWQHPYVNVFKHFNVSSWKKATKEGEVTSAMDKSVKSTVFKITGSIPAGNYIQLPKTSTQSLGLTGRYMYLLIKPIPTKYFVVHIDIATQENLVVRISFSNLFKEFKSTSSWLQFPFVCKATRGTVHAVTALSGKEQSGPAPLSTRWTILCLDFQYILSMYLNRRYAYIKGVRLCANMHVKNIFTSDIQYEPGLTVEQVKRAGGLSGVEPLPRELDYPVMKGDRWHDLYDMIKFPAEASNKPHDTIQFVSSEPSTKAVIPTNNGPRRIDSRKIDASKCVSDRVSMIHNATKEKPFKRRPVTSELPSVGVDDVLDIHRDREGEIHVFAHPEDGVILHQDDRSTGESQISRVDKSEDILPINKKQSYKGLEPDPIMRLKRIIGFGGSTFRDALWMEDGLSLIYPCHAVVVAMKISNGHQRFFIGHTDKVSAISMTGNSELLASGQTGPLSVVRIWRVASGECLALCKTHAHSLSSLSFSHKGTSLCGVGKDSHGKNLVVIWNTSKVGKSREVTVMAKAHTDVDITRMRLAAFDDTRMVSCGRDNVRLWRVKEGSLRSAPVNLGEYHNMEFTDVAFEAGYNPSKDPADRLVYACSRSGHIFEIDLKKVSVQHVRRLLPNEARSDKDKQTFRSGPGIAVNSMAVNETFCVTGSDDGFMRLWPLDFAHVYLEAEHEGPVTAVDFSADGLKILAGTPMGNLGMLDITSRGYTTMMRSHVGSIRSVAVDPYRKHIATVAEDNTIRVWDSESLQQLYDFSAPNECPCTISYHPSRQIFACGFESGVVRVFNVQTTTMLAEHKQHRGKVTGLSFNPNGDYLYSSCSLGSLAMYDATSENYPLLRLLGNTTARGEKYCPDGLAVSPDGRRVAFIGPTEYTVTFVDSKTLDETMRIDVSSVGQSGKSRVDTATRIYYAPQKVDHLLVVTAHNKLLKFEARTGRILSEIEHIHKNSCSSLALSENGRYLATGGDKAIKIWDYSMKLDINFQLFIGHSENVSRLIFTPDSKNLLSVGEALYLWDFLAYRPPSPSEGREYREKDFLTGNTGKPTSVSFRSSKTHEHSPGRESPSYSFLDHPRQTPPRPTRLDSPGRIGDLSSIQRDPYEDEVESVASEREPVLAAAPGSLGRHRPQSALNGSYTQNTDEPHTTPARVPCKRAAPAGMTTRKRHSEHEIVRPAAHKHFVQREKKHGMAQRRYTAPPNQAGVRLKSVIGYNGNARNNMVWHPDTGLFVYTSGNTIILEDLNTNSQKHLAGHVEEISSVALQNDCQVLASASGSFDMSGSQICIWDLPSLVCKKVLTHHEYDIVCLAYSRDDKFLISVGDYRDCTIVVWSTQSYCILTTSKAASPIHHLRWDPYTVNEFSSVGQNGTVLFWLLDETTSNIGLNVHEGEVPDDLLYKKSMGLRKECVEFTCSVYAGDSTLYTGTDNGKVAAWDTNNNSCFMHWEADSSEIGVIISCGNLLLTGSVGRNLRVWSVVGVGEMRLPGETQNVRTGGLTMEDEMNTDGAVVSAAFDDAMEMGIVGTSAGTLWYINWSERTSIRLVSSHMNKVNCLSLCNNDLLASCADDGSLRVWAIQDREQALQFQVKDQACTCLSFAPASHVGRYSSRSEVEAVSHTLPHIVAGYSDGTVRMFDVNKVEMVLKMHPHASAVTAISFSSDGSMILSGGCDGLIAVSSPATGVTVRVISDHKGAPITNIDVTNKLQDQDVGVSAPLLWLATSADRRVSVWSADWSKDFCELVDWLTFPAPAFGPDGNLLPKDDPRVYSQLPPSIARFSPEEPDIIVYTGYGMQKIIQFYSLAQRKVVRTLPLTHWCQSLDLVLECPLIAVGANERLLKLLDYYEGSFQDFVGHNDRLQAVKFSPDGKYLFTASHAEIFIWDVTL
ncbi:WD repeat-containing protein 90-like isoform X2 [Dreissena polymorpha]|uniref:WD repeat-containing protein 90-like isoform X2 n=1 Tax=Dreissena polymorpha TaxID=45954 RepID=UPI00226567C9|nr:WD repeat-containing protein 90-like isoform X2 [Dreissena polymorpha]